jgi:serine/threonine protein kinase
MESPEAKSKIDKVSSIWHSSKLTLDNLCMKRLRRELRVWQRLHHENILPLYGITSDFGTHDSMVCPWLENGNLNKYLERRGDSLALGERFEIVSYTLRICVCN